MKTQLINYVPWPYCYICQGKGYIHTDTQLIICGCGCGKKNIKEIKHLIK